MGERRLIGDDSHVGERIANDIDAGRNGESYLRKRVRRLGNPDVVQPDDIFVSVRYLGPVMVEVRDLGMAVVMIRDMPVNNRRVMVVRIRLVYMFRRERR